MKKRKVLYVTGGAFLTIVGGVALVLSLIIGLLRMGTLFLPTVAEVFFALFPSLLIFIIGVVLIILGIVLPRLKARNAAHTASRHADSLASPTYSYETATEALQARISAWESTVSLNDRKRSDALMALNSLLKGVIDLGKMSEWFSVSLDGPLYDSAREAVSRVDSDKLKMLSGFIAYCASATDYEFSKDYFRRACEHALVEINNALDIYASMRTKLSSFSGNSADLQKLTNEINQITCLF